MAFLLAVSARSQVILRYGPDIDAGYGSAGAIFTPYVTFPAAFMQPYAGNQITKVRIGMCGEAKNVTLYFRKNSHDSRPAYSQKVGTLSQGWNEITLETPYEIAAGEDIAIGYKATAVDNGAAGYSSQVFADGAVVYANSSSAWSSVTGSFCIQALVEGQQMPSDEMLMGKIASQTAGYDDATTPFRGVVRNVGANAISGYTIAVSMDGEALETVAVDKNVAVNESDTFSVAVPSTATGVHALTFTIESVNGTADSYASNNTATATLTVRDRRFRRRVVCEEYTGLWCGWCPRGLVGLELMKEQHPNDFIAISMHGGDKLEVDTAATYNYLAVTDRFSGAPSCLVDRKTTGDPFYDIQSLYAMESAADAAAALDIAAKWNADSTAVTVDATYMAAADIAAADWNLAFTLTEDSITGYTQTNYYYDGRSGEFYGWESKGQYTSDVVFNDVARGIFSNSDGDACHRGALKAEEEQTYEYAFSIPATVRNKRNVHVVGLLLDNATGFVVNAATAVPTGNSASAIATATTSADDMAGCRYEVYSQAGLLLSRGTVSTSLSDIALPQGGLYIVRLTKGQHARTLKIIR